MTRTYAYSYESLQKSVFYTEQSVPCRTTLPSDFDYAYRVTKLSKEYELFILEQNAGLQVFSWVVLIGGSGLERFREI
jgi:hypothetical protein